MNFENSDYERNEQEEFQAKPVSPFADSPYEVASEITPKVKKVKKAGSRKWKKILAGALAAVVLAAVCCGVTAVAMKEFYEDKFVEITPGKHSEQSYDVFERICVFKDQYVFLFYSSITAYVLPISQIRAQISLVDFLSFMSGKCSTIEYD